ncbi:MAG: VCBS repeat-containing protein [Verrucomicrobiia bacterium]
MESTFLNGIELSYIFTDKTLTKLSFNEQMCAYKESISGPFYYGGIGDPTLAAGDLNGDGYTDLIFGDNNKLIAFINKGALSLISVPWILEENIFPALENTTAARPQLVDIDADGDLDLFVGKEASNGNSMGTIDFYRNLGDSQNPSFEKLPTSNYANVAVPTIANPYFADIDNDQDYDLLVGEEGEPLWFYRNVGTPQQAAWQLEGTVPGVDYTDEGAYPAMGDWDNDGDLDLIVGNAHGHFRCFENGGNAFVPKYVYIPTDLEYSCNVTSPYGYSSSYLIGGARPLLIDWDNDTDLDLIVTSPEGAINLIQNIGTIFSPQWQPMKNDFIFADEFTKSGVAANDLNSDGKRDLIISGSCHIAYYQNQGFPSQPNWIRTTTPFTQAGLNYFELAMGAGFTKPVLVDLDNDQDLDLIIGKDNPFDGLLYYCENQSCSSTTFISAPQKY